MRSKSTSVPLEVNASGMVTAVGFCTDTACTAMRARISGLKEVNLRDPSSGELLCGGRVPLPQWSRALDKYADLLAAVVYQCFQAADPGPVTPEDLPILVCVAEPARPGRLSGLDDRLLEELGFRLGMTLHPQSAIIARGRVGGLSALDWAATALSKHHNARCIVAGVDSFFHSEAIRHYVGVRRIMTPDNSNGFFPGEAAAAVLLGRPSGRSGLRIVGWGTGVEPAGIESTEPTRGQGMTAAVGAALAAAGSQLRDVDYRITDLNGEHYKFKEAGIALLRFFDNSSPPRPATPGSPQFDIWHPIEYLGEVGAAVVPLILGLAKHAGDNGYAPGPVALCHVSDDAGDRGAIVICHQHKGN